MTWRRSLLVVLLLLASSPAWAVKEWYDHYLEARDRLIPAGRHQEALAALQAAVKLKPASAADEQTYGLQFVDYLPYYHQGLCYLRLGDFNSALRLLNIEESQGAIRRTGLYKDLLKLRTEAQDAENQRLARLARAEVQRLLKEVAELEKARRYDDALARLAQASKAAAGLDPQTQRSLAEMRETLRASETAAVQAAVRAQRIEQALAEGQRLLEQGRAADAGLRFDEVLGLDAGNARALEGKHRVQEAILASQTRAALEAALREGKALFEAQRYEEALRPLTVAAADPGAAEARRLLDEARAVLERVRAQKDQRLRIEELLAEGEKLLQERNYPAAWVRFESLLELDPTHVRGRERAALAERKTGEAMYERWLPNQGPLMTFFEPRGPATTTSEATVSVVGVATDDRGVARVQFRLGERVVAEHVPPAQLDSAESTRNVPFEREFPLDPGLNRITVTAIDSSGLVHEQGFQVTRRLRFYETPAFLPSALAAAAGVVGAGLGAQRWRRRRAVRRRFNPYIAGAPVMDEGMFFGRAKLMARILNVLHHNSLMITGERRIGKTTFLYHLGRALEADQATDYRFFPVFVDLQGVPEEVFFHTVMSDVVEALRLPAETRAALRFLPDATRYDGRDFSHDLQRVIEELKTRTARKVKLALLIDEVDVLNDYSERVNQRLRGIFMKTFSEHLVAIMSGVGIRRSWNSEGSPWYNFFDEVELACLDREEAEALVREPVQGFFRYEAEAVQAILELSQLKPYVIQKFCIHAVNRMLEEGRTVVSAADVEAVREAVREAPDAVPATPPRPASRPVAD